MNALTDTQLAILALIGDRIAVDVLPPSQAEIARAMGFSGVRAAQYHLEALEEAGAIRRIPGKARGIRVLWPAQIDSPAVPDVLPVAMEPVSDTKTVAWMAKESEDALRLPILGRVAAGSPIGADAGVDDYVLLDRNIFFPSPDYLLKVQGDSMRDEGIFDGDLIGVHRTPEARSGQIVVARIDDCQAAEDRQGSHPSGAAQSGLPTH